MPLQPQNFLHYVVHLTSSLPGYEATAQIIKPSLYSNTVLLMCMVRNDCEMSFQCEHTLRLNMNTTIQTTFTGNLMEKDIL